MWSLCTRSCSKRAHWVPRAHTPPPRFRTREIFRPKRKKGREDENREVIKNNARENSRERANSLFTFDSCYKRTFLTALLRYAVMPSAAERTFCDIPCDTYCDRCNKGIPEDVNSDDFNIQLTASDTRESFDLFHYYYIHTDIVLPKRLVWDRELLAHRR